MRLKLSLKVIFFVLAVAVMLWLARPQIAAADDLLWYAWRSPTGYLYVQDPNLYTMWLADRHATLAAAPALYWPVATHRRPTWSNGHARRVRRECEIRIRSK